ncbi:MAG TPA: hypothetical protein VJ913_11480 [Actinomycetota bacterium]|nr:hypothetical protein [Actinomycetota bacterium]
MSGRATLAATLALAGGVAAGVGSFLAWAEFSAGPFIEQAKGIDGWEGKASLIAGIVMAGGALRVFLQRPRASSGLAVRGVLGGAVALGVALYTAATARDQLLDAAETQLSRAQVERALDSGLLELSLAFGLFVVIAGGVQGILGGLLSISARDEAAASGRGLTGWAAPSGGDPEPPP